MTDLDTQTFHPLQMDFFRDRWDLWDLHLQVKMTALKSIVTSALMSNSAGGPNMDQPLPMGPMNGPGGPMGGPPMPPPPGSGPNGENPSQGPEGFPATSGDGFNSSGEGGNNSGGSEDVPTSRPSPDDQDFSQNSSKSI